MKRVLHTLAVLAVLGLVAGGAVVGLGLYNVSARVGHMPGVSWVMHTTFRNSVRLRASRPKDMPDLSDAALIELGARHYDTACRTCHAAPGEARSATMAAMEPAPPHIETAVQDWQAHHLHWIVANGVKMTGMPAWPAPRDDDVWPVVAFLLAVQDGMTETDYTALTQLPEADAPMAYCLGCHGDGGTNHVPPLNHQSAAYLQASLHAYRSGTRASGIMAQAASGVSPQALDELAHWFARQTPAEPVAAPQMPVQLIAQGRALAHAATGDGDVPACAACHGPNARDASELFPVLSGLPAPYLEQQLLLWRDATRGGGRQAQLMLKATQNLSDTDIFALVAYYATLRTNRSDADE
ncbi:c-type cytochrome [Roseovarius amoyensis]|uniref:c-type cytochrome n=1 Tax=Roseovarius amoyensis TaxID=2211448 RepID=UPI000DBE4572|nr:c-type cytochrome [Roseovarius amoyensis]